MNIPTFISGYKKIIDAFGYFPTFHDDTLLGIDDSKEDKIIFTIKSEASVKVPKITKIRLSGIIKSCGYNIKDCPIILEIQFQKEKDEISLELTPSWINEPSLDSPIYWKAKKVEILNVDELKNQED